MKPYISFVIAFFTTALCAMAQVDSVEMPKPSNPQGQYGTQRVPDQVDEIKEDRVEIGPEQIPPRMKAELERNSIYEGWEKGNVYHERNTDQYLIHIVTENTTHTFRFDKEGNAIKTEAPVNTPETKQ